MTEKSPICNGSGIPLLQPLAGLFAQASLALSGLLLLNENLWAVGRASCHE